MTQETTALDGPALTRASVPTERVLGAIDEFYAGSLEVILSSGADSGAAVDLLLQRAALTGGPVLAAGCGSGSWLVEMARVGHLVTGIERSPARLDVLRRRLASEPTDVAARVLLEQGDMFDAPPSGPFALCVSDCWYLTDDTAKSVRLIRSMANQLVPGGRILLSGFDWMRRVKDTSMGPVRHRERTGNDGTRHVHRKSFRYDRRRGWLWKAVTIERHPPVDSRIQSQSYSWPLTYIDDDLFANILRDAECRLVRTYQVGDEESRWLELKPVG